MEPSGGAKTGSPSGGTGHFFKPLFVRALRDELPELIAEGSIDAATAERLRERYPAPGEGTGRRWALAVFSLLGALLIGSGSILLIAHNWESFTRPTRAALSFALLAAGQAVVAWVLLTGKRELPWREGSGLFAQLAAGACFALVSQTYHISDDLGAFLLAWMLMTLPLVLTGRIRERIRAALSARHVPDDIFQVAAVPRTLSGNKMELPIKKLLLGQSLEKVANPDTMANPESLAWFAELARQRQRGSL